MAARLTAYIVASIVGVTFIAGLLVGAQRDTDGPIDLVIVNGRVFTGSPGDERAEAVAVQGNKILRVGSNREVQRLARAQTLVIDARGGSVLPGFNDAHAHALAGGLGLGGLDLVGAGSVEQIGRLIRSWAERHADRPWITGVGWYRDPFAGGLPTRQLLDQLVPDRPAVLTSHDGRAVWANTAALEHAGITRRTPDPADGTIVREPRSGEPTGVLEEGAASLVTGHVPAPDRAERLMAIRRAIGEAHRHGITSLQGAGGSPDDVDLYDELRREGHLLVRVYAALSAETATTDADLDRLDEVRERFPDDPLLKTGAVTLTVDGSLESHGAALLQPYTGTRSTGQPRYEQAALDRLVAELDRRGWQIAMQAVGDAGVRMSLDALERAARRNPVPERGRRHRIEHAALVDAADLPRFARLGVTASMMPNHGMPDAGRIEMWSSSLGDRAARAWPSGSLADEGARIVFGSGWPFGVLSPWLGLHVAVNRTTLDGRPDDGWAPSERMALDRAVASYTSEAAWASFDEQRKGRLAPDMLADIVVLSRDIFALPSERLGEVEVAFTIFDGKVVYERQVGETNEH